jgi:outer membrane protein TolC
MMRGLVKRVFLAAVVAYGLLSVPLAAQDQPEVLTVDQAVKAALANNRVLKITALQLDAEKQGYAAFKTHRYPSFSTYVFGSQVLAPFSFTVQEGQFGTYKGIGPIPAANTPITTGQVFTAYVVGTVSQPLLTLYKINTALAGKGLSVDMAAQQLVGKRQSVVADVRQAYYTALECEDAIEAAQAGIKQYEELERISTQYVAEQVVLKSELLEVQAKLAQERLSLLKFQDKLATAQDQLNNLMGRDIHTPFSLAPAAALSPAEDNLPLAESTALAQNSDVKESEITIKQAENMVKQARAKYLPDIDASIHYLSPFGVNFVPTNVAGLGIEFNWEPWDWNRRKHEVDEKTIKVEESKINLDETKSQVLLNVDREYRAVHEAQAAVAAAEMFRTSSREKLREVTEMYGQKTKLLRDVLEQQASVQKANSEYSEAVASFWSAKAKLEKAIGEE